MRRLALLAIVCIWVLLPFPALAQSEVTIESLSVQIWPEYDQPAVLVMYDFQVNDDAELSLTLPKSASIHAVAKQSGNELLTVAAQQAERGETLLVAFAAEKGATYRLEYYQPFNQTGDLRTFAFAWAGDYAVKQMSVSVQEPRGASGLKTTPALSAPTAGPDGLVYHRASYANLAAGQEYTLQVSYQKSGDALSVSGSQVQPSQPVEQAEGRSASLTDSLPWVLGGLGVVLVVGGIAWYQLGGQSRGKGSPSQRKRHTRTEEPPAEDAPLYCPQCGKRAGAQDRFCRACGGKLRREE